MPVKENVIGVLGGMGPAAGVDLVTKIINETDASSDHEHLPVALLSYPERIIDRSTFLFGHTDENPAYAMAEVVRQLEGAGAVVAGVPCNTAHAPSIFDTMQAELDRTGHQIRVLHMIEETVRFMQEKMPHVGRVGTLSTLAVYELGLHRRPLDAAGFEVVVPDDPVKKEIVNRTIFDTEFGLKARSSPVSDEARENLVFAIDHLVDKGADAVVLGCTELPLAPMVEERSDVLLVDPAEILARALIRETYPDSLVPLADHYAAHVQG